MKRGDKLLFVFMLMLLSCSNPSENSLGLVLDVKYENLDQAKVDWPGLFLAKDSVMSIISIIDEDNIVLQKIMYKGLSDTLWTNIFERRKKLGINTTDTILDTFIAKPITLNDSNFTLYFMSFDNSSVEVRKNGQLIYEGKVETFRTKVIIEKKELNKLEVFVNNQNFNLEIPNQYNYIELIKKDSILSCTYLYFSPI